MEINSFGKVNLESKPDMEKCIRRIESWFENDILDRVPVRFSQHNSFVNDSTTLEYHNNHEEQWFDFEFQINRHVKETKNVSYYGETFPVFWCNLGPNIYSSYFGTELIYDEVTSWSKHSIIDWQDIYKYKFSKNNYYYKQTLKYTDAALQMSNDKFLVGYTDLHTGIDCVEAWRGSGMLCMDLYDEPDMVKKAIELADEHFIDVFNSIHTMLFEKGQYSVNWMGIPSVKKLHIPSCDFSAMISTDHFVEFCLPSIKNEIAHMDHNIFHLDGEGVARHIDVILSLPEINAIQWVPSPNNPGGVFAYMDLYKKIQKSGKGLVLDIKPGELESFMELMKPDGIYFCIDTSNPEEQKNIIDKLLKWK